MSSERIGRRGALARAALIPAAAAACALPAGCAPAPPPNPPAPPPSLISAATARAQAVRLFLADFLTRTRAALGVPALAAAILLDGQEEIAGAHGWADPQRGVAAGTQTRFMSGSTGKTLAAALALMQVEQGRLALDAPLAPLFAGTEWYARLPNHDGLSLRVLLQHSEGFPQFLDMWQFRLRFAWDTLRGRDVGYSPQQMLALILDAPALNKPGEAFHYSDLGYDLIGLAIERATGQPYMAALAAQLLGPHRYQGIAPNLSRSIPGLAAGYARSGMLENLVGLSGRVTDGDGVLRFNPRLEYAGGGLNVTPLGLARFYADLFGGKVLGPDALAQMTGSRISLGQIGDARQYYGLGVFITQRPQFGTYYSHSGYYPGFVSVVGAFPDLRLSLAIQANDDRADLAPLLRQAAWGAARAAGMPGVA